MSDEPLEESWADYESGPFCSHWSQDGHPCKCGHDCYDHAEIMVNGRGVHDGACDLCDCKAFVDADA